MCVVAIGVAIAFIAVVAPAAGVSASSTSPCSATAGVTVIVDFTHFSGGKIERGCAPGHPADGLSALHAAGFSTAGTAQYGDAFVCRINGLPSPKKDACAITPSPNAYWAFWKARPSDSQWAYSSVGVLDYRPAAGSIEAFAFGSHASPGIAPSEALPSPPPTPTTTPTTAPATTAAPTTQAPAVSAATVPPAPTTTVAPVVTVAPTSSSAPVRAPAPSRSSTSTATTTTPRVIDRSAAGPAARGGSGSPVAAIVTVAVVLGLAGGAFAFARARRRSRIA